MTLVSWLCRLCGFVITAPPGIHPTAAAYRCDCCGVPDAWEEA